MTVGLINQPRTQNQLFPGPRRRGRLRSVWRPRGILLYAAAMAPGPLHHPPACHIQDYFLPPLSGKLAGLDKKLSKSLDQEVQTGSSPIELSKSPVGPLAESSRYPHHLSLPGWAAWSLIFHACSGGGGFPLGGPSVLASCPKVRSHKVEGRSPGTSPHAATACLQPSQHYQLATCLTISLPSGIALWCGVLVPPI